MEVVVKILWTVLWAVIAMIVYVVAATVYARVAFREVKVDKHGWIVARPGPVSLIFGVLSAVLTILFGFLSLGAVSTASEDRLFFLLVGPPMTALMGFGTILVFWIRVRASETQISYRGLRGWTDFDWDQVLSVDDHAGLGPRLRIKGDRVRYFWPYGYGWAEMRQLFANRDIHFSLQ